MSRLNLFPCTGQKCHWRQIAPRDHNRAADVPDRRTPIPFTSSEIVLGMRGRICSEFVKNTYHGDNVRGKRSQHHSHRVLRLWQAPRSRCGAGNHACERPAQIRHGAPSNKKRAASVHLANRVRANNVLGAGFGEVSCRRASMLRRMNMPTSNLADGDWSKPVGPLRAARSMR
jgi:hypothetical protein